MHRSRAQKSPARRHPPLVRPSRAAEPLVRLRIFGSRTLTGANLVQIMTIAGMYAFQYIGALYLQQVLGYESLTTGLAFLPAPLVIGALMLGLSTRLTTRSGPRTVLLAGLVSILAGLVLFSRAPVGGSYVTEVLPAILLLSIGFGIGMPAMTGLAMSDARPEDAGLASGLFSTTQVVGGSFGLAALTSLAAGRTADLTASGTNPLDALKSGYQLAFGVGALVVTAGLILAAALLRGSKGNDRTSAEAVSPPDRSAVRT